MCLVKMNENTKRGTRSLDASTGREMCTNMEGTHP